MRKKEYIQIHALLAEVTRYLIENGSMSVETLSAYDAVGTRPTSIHDSKQHHYEAMMVLSSIIDSSLTETRTESQHRSMN